MGDGAPVALLTEADSTFSTVAVEAIWQEAVLSVDAPSAPPEAGAVGDVVAAGARLADTEVRAGLPPDAVGAVLSCDADECPEHPAVTSKAVTTDPANPYRTFDCMDTPDGDALDRLTRS